MRTTFPRRSNNMTSPSTDLPWPEVPRVTRTVLLVDVVDFVRLVAQNEADTIRRWHEFVTEVMTRMLPQRGGRLVRSTGDGMVLEFDTVRAAIQCAFAMQTFSAQANEAQPADRWISLRAGLDVGDIYLDVLDIQGHAVNMASRLSTLAQPGEIIVSARVRDQLIPGVDAEIEDLGPCYFRNFSEPVQAFRVREAGLLSRPAMAQRIEPRVPPLVPTIAVMPFDVGGAAPEHRVLGEIVADNLIGQLSTSPSLRVISRLSTSALRGRSPSASEVGQVLGATYVLSGSCHVIGARLMVTAELADTRTQDVVWTCREFATVDDLLQTHSEITARLCEGLSGSICAAELRRVQSQAVPTLEGFSLLLAGSSMMHSSSKREFARGRDLIEHLVERHPRAPTPRAWLAAWYVLRVTRGLVAEGGDGEPMRALDQTRRALDNVPDCSLALAMEGFVHCHMLRDLDTADLRLDAALKVNPNEPMAWLIKSVVQSFRGLGEDAVLSAERALELSPLDPMRHYYEGLGASAALSAGHWQRALELAERSLKVNRNHLPTLRGLAIAQVHTGAIDAARLSARRILDVEPGFTLRQYVERAPRGGEALRERYALALSEAGIPTD